MGNASLTASLRAWQAGTLDRKGQEALARAVYGELKQVARQRLRRESSEPFTPTELVHEAWIRLKPPPGGLGDRTQFFRLASTVMRNLLVDEARERLAAKRGGGAQGVTLRADALGGEVMDDARTLDLDQALARLAADHPRIAEVAVMRCFGGLEVEEVAAALSISPATVKRDWTFGRAWLAEALRGGSGDGH